MVITIQAQYFRAEFMLETDKLMIAINDRIKSRRPRDGHFTKCRAKYHIVNHATNSLIGYFREYDDKTK